MEKLLLDFFTYRLEREFLISARISCTTRDTLNMTDPRQIVTFDGAMEVKQTK